MDNELFSVLERQVENLLERYTELQRENALLREENRRLLEERQGIKGRIDAVLAKIERV